MLENEVEMTKIKTKEELPPDVLAFFESQVDLSDSRYWPDKNLPTWAIYGGRIYKLPQKKFTRISMDGGALMMLSSDGSLYVLFLGSYNHYECCYEQAPYKNRDSG
jgi:hypothetical protein